MDHTLTEQRSYPERYVAGTLPPAEREAFEAHLVDCPRCLDRIEEAERIRGGLAVLEEEDEAPVPLRPRRRAAIPLALAAAAGLAVGAIPSVVARVTARRQAAEAGAAREAAAEARAKAGALAEALERESAARVAAEAARVRAERPQDVALLALAATRGDGDPGAVLRLPAGVPFVLVAVETGGFSQYRARITAADGRLVWEGGPLAATSYGVAAALPASLLPPGSYRLALEGVAGGRVVPAGRFGFRVAPR